MDEKVDSPTILLLNKELVPVNEPKSKSFSGRP